MNTGHDEGKSISIRDFLSAEKLKRFQAMFSHDTQGIKEGSVLPACAHWSYFEESHPKSELSVKGYPRSNQLLPNPEPGSRMLTGGRLLFKKPLIAGTAADLSSTITSIEDIDENGKKNRIYSLSCLTSTKGALAIEEKKEILYRQETEKGAHPIRTSPLDLDPDWKKSKKPDAILLFQYSALTFNSERIFFDQEFAREIEGFPNCMIQPELLLLLSLESFKSDTDGKRLERVEYEFPGPVYLGEQITISGKSTDNHETELRITGPENNVALKASVKWTYNW